MEKTRIPVSGSKLPTIQKRKIELQSNGALRRRSKSLTDITFKSNTNFKMPNKVVKGTRMEQPTTIKKTNKRIASDKLFEETKPKVSKSTKLPDWDYKGRFQQLSEKQKYLQEEYRTLQESHNTLKRQCEDFENILERFKQTEIELKEMKEKYDTLQTTHQKILIELQNLKSEYLKKTSILNEISSAHDQLKIDNETVKNEFEVFKKNCELVEKKLQIEENKNVLLTEANIALQAESLKQEQLRRKLHNDIQNLKGNIRVFCRIRPALGEEVNDRLQCNFTYTSDNSFEIRKSKETLSSISGKMNNTCLDFSFDKVFTPTATQEDIFEEVSEFVQSALDGYHVCVFAYGQTGSGKTFTMQGEEIPESQIGIIPRTFDQIFNTIEKLRSCGWHYTVNASFLEIYNENIRDLLNINSKQNYEVRYNEGKGTTVSNLTTKSITTAKELRSWMVQAQRNRAVAATNYNEHSSRSHAITRVTLEGVSRKTKVTYSGSVNLVDLAGSESAKTSSNDRITETKNINKSLSTLGTVMLSLHSKNQHVPYRNSKLTYLLQSCLGGNSKTLMFLNIAPFEECYSETINSLRFASKVKEVKTNIKRNKKFNSSSSFLDSNL